MPPPKDSVAFQFPLLSTAQNDELLVAIDDRYEIVGQGEVVQRGDYDCERIKYTAFDVWLDVQLGASNAKDVRAKLTSDPAWGPQPFPKRRRITLSFGGHLADYRVGKPVEVGIGSELRDVEEMRKKWNRSGTG